MYLLPNTLKMSILFKGRKQRQHCNTFGTAAWKTKSVMSSSVLLEACIVITVTLGLVFDRSKVNSIFRPFLLYAVIEGMPRKVREDCPNYSRPNAYKIIL